MGNYDGGKSASTACRLPPPRPNPLGCLSTADSDRVQLAASHHRDVGVASAQRSSSNRAQRSAARDDVTTHARVRMSPSLMMTNKWELWYLPARGASSFPLPVFATTSWKKHRQQNICGFNRKKKKSRKVKHFPVCVCATSQMFSDADVSLRLTQLGLHKSPMHPVRPLVHTCG